MNRRRKPLVPPTVDDVREYAASRGCPDFPAQEFIDYYEASDPPWHDGQGKPVLSWRQKFIAVWEKQHIDHVKREAQQKKQSLLPIPGRVCGQKGCQMPAVYKSKGEYDHYYCSGHMPEDVKERYR